jgi:holliday junction DNA helicase RuvA
MIGYLLGSVKDLSSDTALVDVNGVGYELLMPLNDLSDLVLGQKTEFWIHTHVREDAFLLFGFSDKEDRSVFNSLLKVNGVGPKMALAILSGARRAELMRMIEAEDVKALSTLPKVGRKTAEQIILSLKGKLVITDRDQKKVLSPVDQTQLQIRSALVNLGYRSLDVERLVSQFPKDIEFEEGIRQGLSVLSGAAQK